jgi:O-antigen/teichoic acid export membrane protein
MFVALSGGDLIDIIWIGVGLYGLQLILYVIWLSRCHEFTFQPVWPQGKHLRETASYSGFAFVSQVTSMVTYHVDRILLGILASVSQVAYYAIPANIVSRLLNVGALFNSFVFPRAVTLHAVGDLVALRALYVKASRYTFLLLVPVLVPLLLFTPELLTLWLGETFSESAQLTTRILLVAFFVATVSITPSQLYNGMGNSRIGAIYATIGSLINVTLCLILIPIFGAAGAAFASLAAMMQAFFYRRALENELAIGRREQRILHFAISFTALIQVGFCLLIHGFNLISDIYSASFALTSAWLLFYLLWLLLPPRFSSQERVLCGKLLIRIGL